MARPRKQFARLSDGNFKFYTTQSLCAELHVSEKTLSRWRAARLITFVRSAGRFLYPRESVSRFIDQRTTPAVV